MPVQIDEQLEVARQVFSAPDQVVLRIDRSKAPHLLVTVRDEYGSFECEVRYGDTFHPDILRERLQTFRAGREVKIGDWNHNKKLARELVEYLNNKHDPTGRLKWLPRAVFARFVDEYGIRLPELDRFASNNSSDRVAVIRELESIPFSWQKTD